MSASKQLTDSKHNGLAAWRERQAEEKRRRLEELEELRKQSYETVERNGMVYRLIRIPDRYQEPRPDEPAPVQLRRTRKRT